MQHPITLDQLVAAVNKIEDLRVIQKEDRQELTERRDQMLGYIRAKIDEEGLPYRVVRNIMNNRWVKEDINTPYSCSVASETYWSA